MRPLWAKRERITAKQMTIVVKRRYGVEFYAVAWRGRRDILKKVSDFCVDVYGSGSTFFEAQQKADARIAAEKAKSDEQRAHATGHSR